MGEWAQDVRYAWRGLRRSPGFAVTAVLTLALGIGVTVTVAALVWQVLLAPLPYPEPGRIVAVEFHWPGGGPSDSTTGPAGEWVLRHARSFAAAAFDGGVHSANFAVAGRQPASIALGGVSRRFFDVLGAQPALGRGFTAAEDTPKGPQAVVLSYGFWQAAFEANPAVVGRVVHLDGAPATVVGVMPKGFRTEEQGMDGKEQTVAAWDALQEGPGDAGYQYNNYQMIARLRPGVTLAQAQGELRALEQQLYRADPFYNKTVAGMAGKRTYQVWPYAAVVADEIRPSLLVMGGAALAVLLLCCLNLLGLNLARALGRVPEFRLRAMLGARQGTLLRLPLVEAGLLGLGGGVGAVLLSRALLPFLLHSSPVPVPQLSRALGVGGLSGVALVLAGLCAALCGLPSAALMVGRQAVGLQGSGASRSGTSSRGTVRTGGALVVGQVALSLVLLSAAALLVGTLGKLRAEPLGFQPEKLAMFQTSLKGPQFATTAATSQFADAVVARLASTPGVSSAAASFGLPLVRGLNDDGWAEGHPEADGLIQVHTVTPGFLRTLGSTLLAGRSLSSSDAADGQKVILLSAAAARKFFPRRSPLGQTMHVDTKDDMYRVVGVVEDAPADQMGQAPDANVYAPIAQQPDKATAIINGWFPLSFVVRVAGREDVAAIARRAVGAVDPTIPVSGVSTMREVVDSSVAAPRFFAEVSEGFAGFALGLTALGIFGLLSFQVARRTREIGVRMALGATRGRVLGGVLRASAVLCGAGMAAGLVLAALLEPVLQRWIEQVAAIDPSQTQYLPGWAWVLALAGVALGVTALSASLLPARRASRVEPMEALRVD